MQNKLWQRVSTSMNVRFRNFEISQHLSVANQKLPKSGDFVHKTANGGVPDSFSRRRHKRRKSSLTTRD